MNLSFLTPATLGFFWGFAVLTPVHLSYVALQACCVEFIILEGDNLEALFPGASSTIFGYHLSARHLFCLLSALCILPTVWLRDLSVLSYVSGTLPPLYTTLLCKGAPST